MISFWSHLFAETMRRAMSVNDFRFPMRFDIAPSVRWPTVVIRHHRALVIKIRCHWQIYRKKMIDFIITILVFFNWLNLFLNWSNLCLHWSMIPFSSAESAHGLLTLFWTHVFVSYSHWLHQRWRHPISMAIHRGTLLLAMILMLFDLWRTLTGSYEPQHKPDSSGNVKKMGLKVRHRENHRVFF